MSFRLIPDSLIYVTALALLLQPLAMADCGCCLGRGRTVQGAATDTRPCRGARDAERSCCRKAPSARPRGCCCGTGVSGPCDCGPQCGCAKRQRQTPQPATPPSEHERNQIQVTLMVALAASHDLGATPAPEREDLAAADVAASLTSVQTCARLCRYRL